MYTLRRHTAIQGHDDSDQQGQFTISTEEKQAQIANTRTGEGLRTFGDDPFRCNAAMQQGPYWGGGTLTERTDKERYNGVVPGEENPVVSLTSRLLFIPEKPEVC